MPALCQDHVKSIEKTLVDIQTESTYLWPPWPQLRTGGELCGYDAWGLGARLCLWGR